MCQTLRVGLVLFLVTLTTNSLTAQTGEQRARRSAVFRGATTVPTVEKASGRQQEVVTLSPVSKEQQKIVERFTLKGATVLEVPFAGIETPQAILALALIVRPDPGLRCSRRGCRGVVRVGLNNSANINERMQLPGPILIQLFGPDLVEPDTFSITVTNDLKAVRILSISHSAVLNASAANIPATQIPLPVQTVQLGMNAASSTIDMLGLETTELHIGPIEGLDPSDTVTVRLQAVGARVNPSSVQLTQGTMATVKLRSRSQSSGTITAIGPSYVNTTPVSVSMTFPWFFFLFTMIGGLTGGFFRQIFFESSGSTSQKAGRIVASALVGFALTLLLVLGVNLFPVPLPIGDNSEPAGFAAAAIAAILADVVAGIWRKTPTKPPENPAPREHQPA